MLDDPRSRDTGFTGTEFGPDWKEGLTFFWLRILHTTGILCVGKKKVNTEGVTEVKQRGT